VEDENTTRIIMEIAFRDGKNRRVPLILKTVLDRAQEGNIAYLQMKVQNLRYRINEYIKSDHYATTGKYPRENSTEVAYYKIMRWWFD
jgi:hypothetical protein